MELSTPNTGTPCKLHIPSRRARAGVSLSYPSLGCPGFDVRSIT